MSIASASRCALRIRASDAVRPLSGPRDGGSSARNCTSAGRGIRGDRYFDFKDDYKGQITFFSLEIFDELCGALQIQNCSPALVRRNVITSSLDLNELIDQDFEVQGVRFHGMEECRPCYWMDQAIAPGAHEFLKGRGGLRAKILCDGQLRSKAQLPRMTADQHSIASPFARERVG